MTLHLFNGRHAAALCLAALTVATAGHAHGRDGAACEVSVSAASVDYGNLTRGALLEHASAGQILLDTRRVMVQAQCAAARPVALSYQALQADTESYRFGPGSLGIRVLSVQVDGTPHLLARQADRMRTAAELALRPGDRIEPVADGTAAKGRQFQFEIELDPRLPEPATQVSEVTAYQTDGHFQID